MKTRKIVASALALSMGASMLSACSSDKKKSSSSAAEEITVIDEVTDDIPWYSISETIIGEEFYTGEYESVYTSYLGKTDTGFVIKTTTNRKVPDNFDWDDYRYSDFVDDYIMLYNFEGELINCINIGDTLSQIDDENFSVGEMDYVNGAVLITGSSYDVNSYEMTTYNMTIDPANDTTGEWVVNDGSDSDASPSTYRDVDGYSEGVITVGAYTIEKYYCYESDPVSYVLFVTDPEGEETRLDLMDIFPDLEIWNIDGALLIDDDTALIAASSTNNTSLFELDLETMEITDKTEDYDWLGDVSFYQLTSIEGAGSFIMDAYGTNPGITKIDFENQTKEFVLGMNNANINPTKYNSMSIVYADDDTFVLAGDVYEPSMASNMQNTFRMITLTKQATNPNVGKDVIKIATLSELSYAIYESICQFNETSDSVFVTVDRRYSTNNLDYSECDSYEEYMSIYNEGVTSLADQLTVDIIAGDGPDILFDANTLTQLNNPDYLVDLSDIVDGNDDYFTNVFEACKTNGVLYQLPLTISVDAIITTSQYVDANQEGFTYDEFVAFVNGPCNGNNPLYYDTQVNALTGLAATMNDLFADGNGVNYDNEAFRALAEYVKDNISDVSYDDSDYYGSGVAVEGWGEEGEEQVASADGLYSFDSFVESYGSKVDDIRVLGYPSYDGRGPQFRALSSVAVSAQSQNIDACKEYVSYLLGDNIQTLLASTNWSNPVNRTVILNNATQVVERFNADVDEYSQWFTPEEMIMYNIPSEHVSEDIIDDYLAILDSCTNCSQTDIAVNMIITEEIQAYFAGQKNIDQVIDTMSNRINTYLSERG